MRRILVGILLAMMLAILPAAPVFAAAGEYQDVEVTAVPAFVAIECAPLAWTLNDIVGDGVTPKGSIAKSSTYYSNPKGDGLPPTAVVANDEGYFVITNTSSVNIDLVVDMENFTGGNANMTNGETGSPGASSYGAFSWYEGCTYDTGKKIVKLHATVSDVLWTSTTPGEDIDLGITLATQTGAFTGGSASTSTLKITASPDV